MELSESLYRFSEITVPEATCTGYERGANCMLPLIQCMDDEEKRKLDVVFQKEFEKLNLLLSNNGFSTCKDLGKTSFRSLSYNYDKNEEEEDEYSEYQDLNYYEDPNYRLVSSLVKAEAPHFLPTASPHELYQLEKTQEHETVFQNHHKTVSKILI